MNQPVPEFTATARPGATALALIGSANSELALVKDYVIDSAEAAVTVNRDLQRIKLAYEQLEAERVNITGPLHVAWKNANAFFKPALDALQQAEAHCKRLLLGWEQKQEEARREAQRRAEDEARKRRQEEEARAAAERAKAEEIARQKQREAEEAEARRRKAEEEGNARAAAAAAAAAAKAREQAAAATEGAEARIAERQATAPVPAAVEIPEQVKLDGFSSKKVWKGRLKGLTEQERDASFAALVAAAATDPQARALLTLDEKALNRLAGALQKKLCIPGVEAYEDKQAASRRT
jgi:hypothetical protein